MIEIYQNFYPKLKEFGISDKFLRDAIKRYGQEKVLAAVKTCFVNFSKGSKPQNKGEYCRNLIKRSGRATGEKATQEVEKPTVARETVVAPNQKSTENMENEAKFVLSDEKLMNYLSKHYGDDAVLFEEKHRHKIRVNSKRPEQVRSETDKILFNLKKEIFENQVVAQLRLEHPSVFLDLERDYKISQRLRSASVGCMDDYLIQKLKHKFPNSFKTN